MTAIYLSEASMWLGLLHLAYAGTLSMILLAGSVLAIRRRAHLGARASNRVVVGAGLLLFNLAVGLTITYLPNAVVPRGNRLIPVEGFATAVSLLGMVLETTGLVLIIAAVFAPRDAGRGAVPAKLGPDTDPASGDGSASEPASPGERPAERSRR